MNSTELLRSYLDILNEVDQAVANPTAPNQPAALQQTQKVQQKTKTGIQSFAKSLTGGNAKSVGQAMQGLDKISKGSAITGAQSTALEPFIEPLQMILSNPQLKPKFLALVNQAKQSVAKVDPAAVTTPQPK